MYPASSVQSPLIIYLKVLYVIESRNFREDGHEIFLRHGKFYLRIELQCVNYHLIIEHILSLILTSKML